MGAADTFLRSVDHELYLIFKREMHGMHPRSALRRKVSAAPISGSPSSHH